MVRYIFIILCSSFFLFVFVFFAILILTQILWSLKEMKGKKASDLYISSFALDNLNDPQQKRIN